MPLVARRKLAQTWREAVAERAGARAECLLPRFEAMCREGVEPGTAAYRVLEAEGLLWRVDEPGLIVPSSSDPDDLPAA